MKRGQKLGHIVSKETRKKIGMANKGKKRSEEVKNKMCEAHKGFRHSEEAKRKMSLAQKGKNFSGVENGKNTRFKARGNYGRKLLGNNGYRNLHKQITKLFGRPTKCEYCGKDGLVGHKIHWASKSGEYKKDLTDWVRLCVRCHFYKDKIIY